MEIRNKNIIVTGATSGIGNILTKKLFNEGANVAFCGRSCEKMSKLLHDLKGVRGKAYHETFDATIYQSVSQFIQNTISELGEIDVLVNCAGANSSRSPVSDIDIADLEWMLKVNMISPFVFMKEAYNLSMIKRNEGMVINVLSTVCSFSNEGIGSYTASKAGFDSLTKVFRKEVRDAGIKVCSIYPGGVDTPFRDTSRPQYLHPDSVVEAILYMLKQGSNSCVDELVIRPMIEKNFP
ncbi:MAG: SDR family NAD(P)-dependent oxidoreductase [Psychromonas sp.]